MLSNGVESLAVAQGAGGCYEELLRPSASQFGSFVTVGFHDDSIDYALKSVALAASLFVRLAVE